jgi:S-adenosylmethionine hydrolase
MSRTFTRTITTPAAARLVRPGTRPVISFTTDFGSRDPSAGIMRAVVLGIAPDASVIDLSHEVEKFRIRDGALLLWSAAPYLPVGSHVAVVDPGVGTDRRAIAMETARGDHLVGPDNGILLPAAARLGGIVRVHQLESPQYRLPVISSSFHGRDIFAPAAAHLAMGVPLEFLGPAVDPRSLSILDWPEPEVHPGVLRTSIIYIDSFGSAKLSALGSHLFNALGSPDIGQPLFVRVIDPGGAMDFEVAWVETFGNVPPGQPLLLQDSYGRLSLAVNQGSAAIDLGLHEDAEVIVSRGPLPAMGPGMDPAYEPGALEPGPWQAQEPWAGPWQAPELVAGEGPPDGRPFER